MLVLVAIVAFAAGLVVGAGSAAAWLRREPAAPATPPVAAPAPAQPMVEMRGATAPETDGDADLKPVLDATRGVVSELEQRYQGARAESERPKKRAPRSRA